MPARASIVWRTPVPKMTSSPLVGAWPRPRSTVTGCPSHTVAGPPAMLSRPMRLLPRLVYQRFPSVPSTMSVGFSVELNPNGSANVVIAPAGVTRPIRLLFALVKYTLPSGPAAIPHGPDIDAVPNRSVNVTMSPVVADAMGAPITIDAPEQSTRPPGPGTAHDACRMLPRPTTGWNGPAEPRKKG